MNRLVANPNLASTNPMKIWNSSTIFLYLGMTFEIELLHPKAKKLLQDLADLDLISMKEIKSDPFLGAVKKIRSKRSKLSLQDIDSEVKKVRAARYAR